MSTSRGCEITESWAALSRGERPGPIEPAGQDDDQGAVLLRRAAEDALAAALEYKTTEDDPDAGHNARAGYWSQFLEALDHYAELRELTQ